MSSDKMHHQVTVTFTPITGNFAPRTLLLTPRDDTTPIGRASKSVAKGILGAEDNAWFDSPVMSRDHAELRLNSSTSVSKTHNCDDHANSVKTVTIHDRGSMHGTFLNDNKLEEMEDAALNKGDILVFGAEVKRGPEVFPACSFKVDLAFAPYNSGNTFSAPDSDLDEDEEMYGSSDIDKDERDQVSSVDGISIESPSAVDHIACPQPIKVVRSIQAIDLTGDDSPILSGSSQIIDLLSPSPDFQAMEAAPDTSTNMDRTVQQGRVVMHSEDESLFIGDSEEDYSELDDRSDVALSEGSEGSEDSDDCLSEDSMELDGEDAEEMSESSDSENADDDIHDSFSEQDIDSSAQHFSTYPQILSTPVKTQNYAAGSEDFMDSDDNDEGDDHDLGHVNESTGALLDESANRHLLECVLAKQNRTVTAAPMRETTFNSVDGILDEILHAADEDSEASDAESHAPIPNSAVLGESSAGPVSSGPVDFLPAKDLSYQRGPLVGISLAARQPSPSDAAMVKKSPPKSTEQTSFFKPLDHSQISQALGDKTGKHAFFEAREKNKAKLVSETENQIQYAFPILESDTPMEYKRALGEWNEFPAKQNNNTFGATKSSTSQASKSSVFLNRASEWNTPYQMQESFLAIPPVSSTKLERATSPDYDMTSAVSFNESKAKSIRSRVSIHDIIESSPRAPSPPKAEAKAGNKRKADEISNSIQEEVRAWASSPDRPLVETATDIATTVQEERPTKKLKTVLDRVAYAAVGGFAVGATLFFGLVATAPDFA
ncbi:hypothetical protein HYFRA_00003332 [Hymenoscyphus fraxineus]|uniref:FHA domain-containing protein n=1 Tax=Hymenoscyphus fraxineus TaxID=746836 RepID=A0A9N9PHJ4_9HELO|nr:hypothetical protein HYFRA_00003332 [Hymenoscyphus fraxineus]